MTGASRRPMRKDQREVLAGAIGGLVGGAALSVAFLLLERATRENSDLVQIGRRGAWQLGQRHHPLPAPPSAAEELSVHGGHMVLSGVLGVGYAVLRRGLALGSVPSGLLFGLGFYPLAFGLLGPLLGITKAPWQEKPRLLVQRAVAHAVFGTVTAFTADRTARRL